MHDYISYFFFRGKSCFWISGGRRKKEQKHEILRETCHSSSLNDKNANGRVYIFALAQNLYSKIAPSRSHVLVKKRTILGIWFSSYFFFRNKSFLFVKIKSRNSSFRQLLFSFFLWVVFMNRNFVRFQWILNQKDAENFSCLSWPKKYIC